MNLNKMSGDMLLQLESFKQRKRSPRHTRRAAAQSTTVPEEISIIIHCAEDANLDSFDWLTIHSRKGTICTASLTLNDMHLLDQLTKDPRINHINYPATLSLSNDVAAARTNLPVYRKKSNNTGKGVIIGIIDSGIDASHPSFSGRIHCIWDQTASNGTQISVPYGTLYDNQNQFSSSIDSVGHGTHVAGIAAGNDGQYGGVAPEATLVIVKSNLNTDHIIDGIRFIFEFAGKLNMPAVINLSIEGHDGAHDGTDELSIAIDQESGEGRIIIAAAGNKGGKHIHAEAKIAPNSCDKIEFNVIGDINNLKLQGWYSGSTPLEIGLQDNNGNVTNLHAVQSIYSTHTLPGGTVSITTSLPIANSNGDHQFILSITPVVGTAFIQTGNWSVVFKNPNNQDVCVDLWVANDNHFPAKADASFIGKHALDSKKIGTPGCASSAITVGSYTTRNSWATPGGPMSPKGSSEGEVSKFSSPGPRRTDGSKPDVLAPGEFIVSAKSSNAPNNLVCNINSLWTVDCGTSMAAPFITGITALLLQRNPKLDPAKLKTLLRSACKHNASSIKNNLQSGSGMIDAGRL